MSSLGSIRHMHSFSNGSTRSWPLGLVLFENILFACAVASVGQDFFLIFCLFSLGPTMASPPASVASGQDQESWANMEVATGTGQMLEAVIAHTEPQPLQTGQSGQSVEDDGYEQPIGVMILGQPTAGQDDAADQALLGQAAGSGPMSSLGSWNVQPLPSIDLQAGQSDGQSSIGTWIIPDLGSSQEKIG